MVFVRSSPAVPPFFVLRHRTVCPGSHRKAGVSESLRVSRAGTSKPLFPGPLRRDWQGKGEEREREGQGQGEGQRKGERQREAEGSEAEGAPYVPDASQGPEGISQYRKTSRGFRGLRGGAGADGGRSPRVQAPAEILSRKKSENTPVALSGDSPGKLKPMQRPLRKTRNRKRPPPAALQVPSADNEVAEHLDAGGPEVTPSGTSLNEPCLREGSNG